MFIVSQGQVKFRIILVLISLCVVHAACVIYPVNFAGSGLSFSGSAWADGKKRPPPGLEISDNVDKLPVQVAEMRDAILDAARRGDIDDLLDPIQMNELKPDFGDVAADAPLQGWKSLSIDGQGREVLAILTDILESPYAVIRQGQDIENNKIYVWPYFAEVPINKLPPHLDTQLLRLIPREDYKVMKKTGKYTFWRLTIGADGTWHSFKRSK